MRRPGQKNMGWPLFSGRREKIKSVYLIEFNNSIKSSKYLIETVDFNNCFKWISITIILYRLVRRLGDRGKVLWWAGEGIGKVVGSGGGRGHKVR